jgi:DNA polymerase-3 subunit alpha
MSFVHLHNHSDFSLLDGALRIPELVAFAKEQGMPAVALTDHGNMFGMIDFINECKKAEIKPIPGQEFYFTEVSRHDRGRENPIHHLTLLAMNAAGYRNLCKLSSIAWTEGFYYKPRVDWESLAAHHEGIIALSGCLKGFIPARLLKGDRPAAVEFALRMKELMGPDRFYIEVMRAKLDEQEAVLPLLASLASETGLGLVATNDVHYRTQEDSVLQELLICINTSKKMDDPDRLRFQSREFFLKTGEEMRELFADYPQAVENTLKIASMVNFSLKTENYHLPPFDVPGGFPSPMVYLRHLAEEGLKGRLAEERPRARAQEEYWERLEMELGVIDNMGFPSYFLILQDIIGKARERGIPVGPGRGSAAGSLVAYALGIVDVDPLEYDLIFERFLNPDRISMPDIDVDVCQRRRGEVLQYIRERYGERSVCQIITFKPLKAKGVVRDVARVLGFPYDLGDRISKAIPNDPKITIEKAREASPELRAMEAAEPQVAQVLAYGSRLTDINRNYSVHAAGVVITPGETSDFVPLAKDPKGQGIITQYTFHPLEKLGLLKMDILGLATLTVIHDTLESIREEEGTVIDLLTLPMDDPTTYALFARGETDGIFQFESDGMKEYLKALKPTSITDLTAMNALYRPGPLGARIGGSNMVDLFIRRKQGEEAVTYPVPGMEPILKDTYGVIVFQEQVMRLAVDIAGYSMAEADQLRKVMGKKITSEIPKQKEKFIKGAKARGHKERDAQGIFDLIEPFAEYGFNKAHSACYAVLAYYTAWLKTHYSAHFMAAQLQSEISDTDKLVKHIRSAEAMGLVILPPDINRSRAAFAVEEGRIRFGLGDIKGMGEQAAQAIVDARRNGPFESIGDFLRRVDSALINRKALDVLIKAGAFDAVHPSRSALFNNLDALAAQVQKARKDREARQSSLFAQADWAPETDLADPEPWTARQRLAFEKEALGFFFSGHPLAEHEHLLRLFTDAPLAELKGWEKAATVRVGGVVTQLVRQVVKGGANANRPMARFELEDTSGRIRAVVFPDDYARLSARIQADAAVLVKARVSANNEGTLELHVSDCFPLEDAPKMEASGLMVRLAKEVSEEEVEKVLALLQEHPGPLPVQFIVQRERAYRVVLKPGIPLRVRPDAALLQGITGALGPNAVYYLF